MIFFCTDLRFDPCRVPQRPLFGGYSSIFVRGGSKRRGGNGRNNGERSNAVIRPIENRWAIRGAKIGWTDWVVYAGKYLPVECPRRSTASSDLSGRRWQKNRQCGDRENRAAATRRTKINSMKRGIAINRSRNYRADL